MDGGTTFGAALAKVFWFMGEISFKLVPGTVASFIGTDPSGIGPIPTGLTPITGPVTTTGIISFLERNSAPDEYASLVHFWNVFTSVTLTISLLCASLIIYCFIRIRQIRHIEHLRFEAAKHPVIAKDIPKIQLRWNRLQEQAHSDNEQNWRLAILEADIMLNELLDIKGYKGDTMADKMKQVERGDFNTIDNAWEAHRVRNRIAHEGTGLQLNSREVERVMSLYEKVFKEFKLIQ